MTETTSCRAMTSWLGPWIANPGVLNSKPLRGSYTLIGYTESKNGFEEKKYIVQKKYFLKFANLSLLFTFDSPPKSVLTLFKSSLHISKKRLCAENY